MSAFDNIPLRPASDINGLYNLCQRWVEANQKWRETGAVKDAGESAR